MNARGAEALEAAAEAIRGDFGVEVTTVACDVTTPEGQAKVLEPRARLIFWSTTPVARRRACGRIGTARISSPPWMPIC